MAAGRFSWRPVIAVRVSVCVYDCVCAVCVCEYAVCAQLWRVWGFTILLIYNNYKSVSNALNKTCSSQRGAKCQRREMVRGAYLEVCATQNNSISIALRSTWGSRGNGSSINSQAAAAAGAGRQQSPSQLQPQTVANAHTHGHTPANGIVYKQQACRKHTHTHIKRGRGGCRLQFCNLF